MRSIDECLSVSLRAVRIKLGPGSAGTLSPIRLGRDRIGNLQGLSVRTVERGRGVWKAQLPKVSEADLLVLVHAGIVVVGVGSIDGARFMDRVAITGRPALPEHPSTRLARCRTRPATRSPSTPPTRQRQ